MSSLNSDLVITAPPVAVARVDAILGEGPIWVEREQALYWLDIKAPAIYRGTESGEVRAWTPPFWICSLAPRVGGGFVGGSRHGLVAIDLDRETYDRIADPETALPDNRFNDGKVDRHGHFWAGTMDNREEEATGALYRFDPDLGCTKIDEGYRVTNGPAFSPDGLIMYHNDSGLRNIYAFDMDEGGTASNRRIFAHFPEEMGYPDGMTVDAEGCLWVAFWDGWAVRRLSREGKVIEEVPMPVQRPTSCAFGGPALDQLFVTSARIGLNENALAVQPLAGALFMVETAVRGIAEQPFG